jgi:hypothetical protein
MGQALTLANGTVICLESSANNQLNIPEEQGSHLYRCGSLKSRKISSVSISSSINELCFYNTEHFHKVC